MLSQALNRRKERNRNKIRSVANGRPRLSVFVSNRYIYAQIIDDVARRTLVSASSLENSELSNKCNVEAAKAVGSVLASRAVKHDIAEVVFDRGGKAYHGKLRGLADAARAGGLKF